jgi:hypothetical protein
MLPITVLMSSFLEFLRSTSPFQEFDVCVAQSTAPLFDVAEILLSIERLHSTSSLQEESRPVDLNSAFIQGGRDERLYAVVLGSDTVCADASRIDREDSMCIRAVAPSKVTPVEPKATDPQCNNCFCTETTLWRRVGNELMCNACALYYKLHGCRRPKELVKTEIKRRQRRSTISR